MSLRRAAALFCVVAVSFWACSDPNGPPVLTISVIPPIAELAIGDTVSLRAVGLSAEGDTIPALAISWSSADTTVATVSPNGVVSGHGAGSVSIQATSGVIAGHSDITVNVHFAAVSVGSDHYCGLSGDGTAYCWGENYFGQLGLGSTDPQGSPRTSPQPVAGGHRFQAIAAGTSFTCGLTTDSLAWCWGQNFSGNLGIGLVDTLVHPVPLAVVGGHHFQHLSVAWQRACATTAAGPTYCWGWNYWGANGTAVPPDSISVSPQPVTGTPTLSMTATADARTCGLSVAQAVYCWGANGSGELGYVTDSIFITPLPVADSVVFSTLTAGGTQACGLDNSGAALCWGTQEFGEGYMVRRSPKPMAPGLQLSRISASSSVCGLDMAGAAWCWGSNFIGELGDGTTETSVVPVRVTGGHTFTEISVGSATVCGVAGGAAYCWGSNYAGSLGRGFISSYDTVPGLVAGGVSFTAVVVGSGHVCGLATDSTAWCWGSNYDGQLGDSSKVDRWQPVAVRGGLKFGAIVPGGSDPYHAHTCGLTTGGIAYCWGNGADGQLGTGSTSSSTVPVPVSGGLSFTRISSGGSGHPFNCAVARSGTVYCWGSNQDGILGDADTTLSSPTPNAVAGTSGFEDVEAGVRFVCGRTGLGKVYCWGRNSSGQLGQGYLGIESRLPHAVSGGHSFIQVSTGLSHSCGLAADSTAWCWGRNVEGQLGTGDLVSSIAPRAVASGLHFSSVGAGYHESCGLTASGAAYCWGYGGPAVPTQIQPGTSFLSLVSGPGSTFCGVRADSLAVCVPNPFGSGPAHPLSRFRSLYPQPKGVLVRRAP